MVTGFLCLHLIVWFIDFYTCSLIYLYLYTCSACCTLTWLMFYFSIQWMWKRCMEYESVTRTRGRWPTNHAVGGQKKMMVRQDRALIHLSLSDRRLTSTQLQQNVRLDSAGLQRDDGSAAYSETMVRPRTARRWFVHVTARRWFVRVQRDDGSATYSETMVRPHTARRWFGRVQRDDGSAAYSETMVRPRTARRWFGRIQRDDGSAAYSETMVRPCNSETMVRPRTARRWFVRVTARRWFGRVQRDDGSAAYSETMVRPRTARRWFGRVQRDDGSSAYSWIWKSREPQWTTSMATRQVLCVTTHSWRSVRSNLTQTITRLA